MEYNFTKGGKFLFNLTLKWTMFISKHRWLYYLLMFTWGLPLTLVGLLTTVFMWFGGQNPQKYYWSYCFKVGKLWGGFTLGNMFIRDGKSIDSLSAHEFGHTIQNTLFGIFGIFLVSIPSTIRFWVRKRKSNKGEILVPYDSVWFEASATTCGEFLSNYCKKEEENGI